jgi:hypothetical protein
VIDEQAKIDLGTWDFAAQHQQEPLPESGGIFLRSWFKRYTKATLPPVYAEHLQSWDFTFKKKEDTDFVVGQVWSRLGADCYLRFERRGRMGFSESKRAVRDTTKAWPAATLKLIEDKANGPAIIEELRTDIDGIVAVQNNDDVLARRVGDSGLRRGGQHLDPGQLRVARGRRLARRGVHLPEGDVRRSRRGVRPGGPAPQAPRRIRPRKPPEGEKLTEAAAVAKQKSKRHLPRPCSAVHRRSMYLSDGPIVRSTRRTILLSVAPIPQSRQRRRADIDLTKRRDRFTHSLHIGLLSRCSSTRREPSK